jgi:hypothetical protein
MEPRYKLRQAVIGPEREVSAIDFSLDTARTPFLNDENTTKDQLSRNGSCFNLKEEEEEEEKFNVDFIKNLKYNPKLNIKNLKSPSQTHKNALEKVDSTAIKRKPEASTRFKTSAYISSSILCIRL